MNYKHSTRLAFSALALGTYSIFGCGVNDYPTSAVQEQPPSQGYVLPYSTGASLGEKIEAVEDLAQAISDTSEGLVLVFVSGPGNSIISSRSKGGKGINLVTIFDPSLDANGLPLTAKELREIVEATY